jgi:hypothetical protein
MERNRQATLRGGCDKRAASRGAVAGDPMRDGPFPTRGSSCSPHVHTRDGHAESGFWLEGVAHVALEHLGAVDQRRPAGAQTRSSAPDPGKMVFGYRRVKSRSNDQRCVALGPCHALPEASARA